MTNPFAQPNSWADRTLAAIASRGQTAGHAYVFLTSCVASTTELIDALTDDNTAVAVDYAEMNAHCDLRVFEAELGYDPEGLQLKNDWHVSFYRSTYAGCPCYYLDHSGIEYIWVLAAQWKPEMAERCSGCGNTPCPRSNDGCCPNQPNSQPSYMDDSWGDFETEPET